MAIAIMDLRIEHGHFPYVKLPEGNEKKHGKHVIEATLTMDKYGD